jgi:hypothetical protein
MRSLLVMGIPYQHAPEVSIVRTDTCSAGSGPLHAIVERSRYAACKTGLLRLRPSHAVGLVLHWPLTGTSSGCQRFAVPDAWQTINCIL